MLKVFRKMEVPSPLDQASFFKNLLLYSLSVGAIYICTTQIYFALKAEFGVQKAIFFLYTAIVIIMILAIKWVSGFQQIFIARARSIDPHYKGKTGLFIGSLIYVPISFLLLILFMSLAKPGSCKGKLNHIFKCSGVAATLIFILASLSLCMNLRHEKPQPRIQKASSNLSYYLSGPMVHYIDAVLANSQNMIALGQNNSDNLLTLLSEAEKICIEPAIHTTLLRALIIEKARLLKKRNPASITKSDLITYLNKAGRNCSKKSMFLAHTNPLWLMQPGTAMERILVLLVGEKTQEFLEKKVVTFLDQKRLGHLHQ